MIDETIKKKRKLSVVGFLFLGYLVTISFGTILLLLPFSFKESIDLSSFKNIINWIINTFLTATSATCVTGLITFDTGIHWTRFGQIVIIVLIQIGGLGFMTILTLFMRMIGRKSSLFEKSVLMQSAGSYSISGVKRLIVTILISTFVVEACGAALLTVRFSKLYPTLETSEAVFYGIFHSISAFCNAGFDLMGPISGEFSSLTALKSDAILNIEIMVLIVFGGLGFIVWQDLFLSKFRFRRLQLHSKIVLTATLTLVLSAAICYFIFEFKNDKPNSMGQMDIPQKILASFFMSITPRTAGFNTIDLNNLTPSSKLLTMILMFIGGNSGSTAGGVKVTTVVVVILNLISNARNESQIEIFNRKVSTKLIRQASSLFIAYLSIIFVASFLISTIEGSAYPLEDYVLEVISAVGTVGLGLMSLASSTMVTRIIIIALMYIGRLGAFALFSLLLEKNKRSELLSRPEGNVLVG